jgi:hypothetical protein
MNNRRLLQMMAGIIPTPYEKRLMREQRQLERYARDLQSREQLMAIAQRRERGDADVRPMPLAIPRTQDTPNE